ncbi:DUF4173 domain-containing protein [Candidatus Uhrbacteria bacterium]|nr:DUF4173 domain-containing protein [Candidatus Uhrbacteria bacterium]
MKNSLVIFLIAFGLTIGFHFLLAERMFGLAFIFFVLLGLLAILGVAAFAKGFHNGWAFLFLIPVAFTLIAELLYANEVVHRLGFFIPFISLAFFAYWLTAEHEPLKTLKSFWPISFFVETIFPFLGLGKMFSGESYSKHIWQVVLGLIIAVPFLFIFGSLFASADPLFGQSISHFFNTENIGPLLGKLSRDGIVGVFFLAFGWTMFTRVHAHRGKITIERNWNIIRHPLMLDTFLIVLNVFFLIFLGYQAVYFFGGAAMIQLQGITYASYAREGFFQLLMVGALVFLLSSAIYRTSRIQRFLTCLLITTLIVETGVILASALKRLILYVQAYGLTVSRSWAMIVILFIAAILILLIMSLWRRFQFSTLAKISFLSTLIFFSFVLLFNMEGFVARWNIQRFLHQQSSTLDVSYLEHLSSDALPELADFSIQSWPTVITDRALVQTTLKNARLNLLERSKDWRNLVWSDYRALTALESFK